MQHMKALIERDAPLGRIDFIEAASTATLAPMTTITGDAVIALAMYVGDTRLIDNTVVRFVDGVPHFQ